MKWPFKHLKQTSQWPLQGVACSLSAAAMAVPSAMRKAAKTKTVERTYRLAARVCHELEVHPALALALAEELLCLEIPGAKQAILEAKAKKAEHTEAQAQDLLAQMLGGPETGEA